VRQPQTSERTLSLDDESSSTKLLVHADTDSPAARALGMRFGSARRSDHVLVCGVRPNEWLVIGPADGCTRLVGSLVREGHVSVVDLTHSRAMIRIAGGAAPSVLEKVCSIDWGDHMTPDGAVVSASLAKVTCDIIRDDVEGTRSYLVACDRSFGQYLYDALVDAAQEFALAR
jgi:heterotetrameric sarcosine oxidase gamma subunit